MTSGSTIMILLYFVSGIGIVKGIYVCTKKEMPRLEQDLITLYVCLPLASFLLFIEISGGDT
jgi:hypothetical protein